MSVPLDAALPPNLDLGPGFTVRVTARSTSDGSVVSNVTVDTFSILVGDTGDGTPGLAYGPFMLVPGPGA